MFDSDNIKAIIQSGEGYNAEFKQALPKKLKDISSEICAFANSSGGLLIIGVNDDNVIVGSRLSNFQRSALQNSINEINPHINCEMYSAIINSQEIWVIEVHSGKQKTYVLSGVIYIRQASNTQKLVSVEEMRDFFQQSSRIYFDEVPCDKFDANFDIDELYFEEFKIAAKLSTAISQAQIVENLQLTTDKGKFKNGGVLFFGQTPEFFIDKAVIRCVAFDGVDKSQIIDDKVYGGVLMSQYQNTMQWLKSKLNISYVIEDGNPRKEVWEIPEVALKEAMINALSHRDYYDKGARITVELFSDRLEISNPGGLVAAIKPEEFGTKSHSRNSLIFGLFERINMVEQIGSGVSRINQALLDAKIDKATYKMDGFFTLIFKRKLSDKLGDKLGDRLGDSLRDRLGENESKIFKLIKKDPMIKTVKLSKALDISTTAVENNIRKLKNKQLIRREGSERSGFFVIVADKKWGEKWGEKLGKNKGNNLSNNQQAILNKIQHNPHIKIKEIATLLTLSTSTIENNLKKLKQKQLIKRQGSARKGYWEIL